MDIPHQHEGLDALVLTYLERVEDGEAADRVLAELCARHPKQAEALRRGVDLLMETRLHPGPAGDGLPERIGPFHLLRRLGAGGMGVVYLAQQDAPARQVALKLVRPDQLLFDGYRDRFEREIQSAGRLSHPGIAAVYEMGEHDGLPWFSQEYIGGATLSDLLASVPARSPEQLTGADLRAALADAMQGEVPLTASDWDEEFFTGSWSEVCLRITRQVAEALQHAHERGVLHRDVKPSNVLITPKGRSVLVDFGLASLQGSDRLTRTGAQVGSLHYMPPEQVDGNSASIGPHSDVYSLGVTLYELLTLRAPYASQSVERLRGLILGGQAPEPRKVNVAVSRAASIVCGCAMERDSERRYASTAELARDISAVLAHKPIAALPPSPLRRAMQWSQRHPGRAVGLIAGLLIVTLGPILFGLQRNRAAKHLARVNADLEREARRSEANYQSAVEAVERVMRWTADEGLDDVPGMQATRLHVIEEALQLFDELQRERPEDPDVRLRRASLERTRGEILQWRADHAGAEQALEAVADEIGFDAKQPNTETAVLFELATSRHQLAFLAYDDLQFERAEVLQREALELSRQIVAREPDSHGHRRDLGTCLAYLGRSVHHGRGPIDEAGALFAESEGVLAELLALESPGALVWRAQSDLLAFRADWQNDRGDSQAAAEDWEHAVAAGERACALAPRDRKLRQAQIVMLEDAAAHAASGQRDPERALALLRQALVEHGELVSAHRDIPELEDQGLNIQSTLAAALRRAGRRAEARSVLESVIAVRQDRLDTGSASPGETTTLAKDLINLSNFAANEPRGVERYEEVLELLDRVDRLFGHDDVAPGDGHRVRRMRVFQAHGRGSAWAGLGDPDEVLREAQALDALAVEEPTSIFMGADLWAEWYALTGDEQGRQAAIERLERAVQSGFNDPIALEQARTAELLDQHPRVLELIETVKGRHAQR